MKKTISLILALLMIVSLVACGGGGSSTSSTTSGTTSEGFSSGTVGETTDGSKSGRTDLKLSLNKVQGTTDPHDINDITGELLVWNVYEGLFFVTDTGELEPRIAESYTVADDNMTYTIKLREGVKFHNGETCTAEDVAYSFERAKGFSRMATKIQNVESVKAIDVTTVEIKSDVPVATFMATISNLKIVSMKDAKAFGDKAGYDFANTMAGTGPYKFVAVALDRAIELEAFADYYRGEAAIKKVHYAVMTDAATVQVALEAGEIDFASATTANVSLIKENENLNVYLNPSTHNTYLKFNYYDNKYLADKRVRQAINYAINKEELMYGCYDGYGDIAENFAREGMVFGATTDGVTVYSYNIEKAKELLKEAGYPDGFNIGTLWATTSTAYFSKAAQIVQQQLEAVGITCELKLFDSSTISEVIFRGGDSWDVAIHGGGISVDSDNFYNWMFNPVSGTYLGRTAGDVRHPINQRLVELGELGRTTLDPEKRKEIYKEFWQIAQDEAYITALFHRYNPYGANKLLNVKLYANYYYLYDFSWQ